MYYKISYKLIALVIAVITAVTIVGVIIINSINNNKKEKIIQEQKSNSEPQMELSVNTSDPDQDEIVITATISTEDENGIASVTLPSGVIVKKNGETNLSVDYTVQENGNYEFKARGTNGKQTSLTINIENIRKISADSPYIPTGFHYVAGEVADGYTIEDDYGNQYVWIPVYNGKMTRNTLYDAKYEEKENSTSSLVNSVAKYYGFYIARFEASYCQNNSKSAAGSAANLDPWTNITYEEAEDVAERTSEVLGYGDYETILINSYAWDTTLAWLDQNNENYSSSDNCGNYSGTIRKTGTTETDIKNNICDMAGNVREWTSESYVSSSNNSEDENEISNINVIYKIIRGGSAAIDRTANSHTAYKSTDKDPSWGFRTVLFK